MNRTQTNRYSQAVVQSTRSSTRFSHDTMPQGMTSNAMAICTLVIPSPPELLLLMCRWASMGCNQMPGR